MKKYNTLKGVVLWLKGRCLKEFEMTLNPSALLPLKLLNTTLRHFFFFFKKNLMVLDSICFKKLYTRATKSLRNKLTLSTFSTYGEFNFQ